eukprot:m.23021 g.23021  ORF g.23021 m.23021 type:complete len:504 (+) comp11323_c0_seq1:206-1717(+)
MGLSKEEKKAQKLAAAQAKAEEKERKKQEKLRLKEEKKLAKANKKGAAASPPKPATTANEDLPLEQTAPSIAAPSEPIPTAAEPLEAGPEPIAAPTEAAAVEEAAPEPVVPTEVEQEPKPAEPEPQVAAVTEPEVPVEIAKASEPAAEPPAAVEPEPAVQPSEPVEAELPSQAEPEPEPVVVAPPAPVEKTPADSSAPTEPDQPKAKGGWTASAAPKCHACTKSAYANESIQIGSVWFHKATCLKCSECSMRLTLSTFKTSDFGQDEIFCSKCVPKVAPTQASESVEYSRAKEASRMTAEVRMVNEQVRLESTPSPTSKAKGFSVSAPVKPSGKKSPVTGAFNTSAIAKPKATRGGLHELAMSGTPRCPVCTKLAYPAESIKVHEHSYHKMCFKCAVCALRLTLTTFKTSDFGDEDIFCAKCVPKVAPTQSNDTAEYARLKAAGKMTTDVRSKGSLPYADNYQSAQFSHLSLCRSFPGTPNLIGCFGVQVRMVNEQVRNNDLE